MREMSEYAYRARGRDGRERCGVLQATSEAEVAAYIRARQCYVTSVVRCAPRKEKHWERRPASWANWLFFAASFLLIDAGVSFRPLASAAPSGRKSSMENGFRRSGATNPGGNSLTGALSRQSAFFPPLLFRHGRRRKLPGAMEAILGRLAIYFEKEHSLKQNVLVVVISRLGIADGVSLDFLHAFVCTAGFCGSVCPNEPGASLVDAVVTARKFLVKGAGRDQAGVDS